MNTTLLVDGNWLLMSRLFAAHDYFNVQNDKDEKLKGTAILEDLMARSINIILNRFSNVIDNVIIVQDGGSWRKTVEKPKGYEEVYKGNRVKDSQSDWEYIYKAIDDVAEAARDAGITTTKAYGVEGDDWIWYWSRTLNKQGKNCIIWSTDCDLKQLVQVENGAFTAWYNEKPGLVLHNDLNDTMIDDIDFFMRPDMSSATLDALRAAASTVTYIDPSDIVESKIICGDGGDNIKSIIRIQRGEKIYRVSESQWTKYKEELGIASLDDFLSRKDEIVSHIAGQKKYKTYDIDAVKASDMFDYNTKLVWLNESVYPQEIMEKMQAAEYKNCDLSFIQSNYKTLVKLKDEENVENIFEGAFENAPF